MAKVKKIDARSEDIVVCPVCSSCFSAYDERAEEAWECGNCGEIYKCKFDAETCCPDEEEDEEGEVDE